jgi:hypothetical protein
MTGGQDQKTLAAVTSAAAQIKAMQGQTVFLPHGSRLFLVAPGWETKTIAADRHVATCKTVMEFQSAMQDENVQIVFVPADALLQQADIERVCQRCAAAKTIFAERLTS